MYFDEFVKHIAELAEQKIREELEQEQKLEAIENELAAHIEKCDDMKAKGDVNAYVKEKAAIEITMAKKEKAEANKPKFMTPEAAEQEYKELYEAIAGMKEEKIKNIKKAIEEIYSSLEELAAAHDEWREVAREYKKVMEIEPKAPYSTMLNYSYDIENALNYCRKVLGDPTNADDRSGSNVWSKSYIISLH